MAETKTKAKPKPKAASASKASSATKTNSATPAPSANRSPGPQGAQGAKASSTADILTADTVASLKEQLLHKRQRIVDLYAADVRAGQEATQEGTDDIVDRANNSYNRELMFSLSSAEREQVIEVDAALRRIDDGTYGFCQHSGKPIALARLQAVPWARYSIEYQELAEKGLLEEEGGHAN